MTDKRNVTVRPPLTSEDEARIFYIAKKNRMPKERAVAAIIRRGIALEQAGDEMLNRILREEATEYHTDRTAPKKPVRVRKLKKHTATLVGG